MERSTYISWAIILASAVLVGLSFLLPVFGGTDPLQVHIRTSVSVTAAALSAGAATWFLTGLKSFKRDLRVAYRLLATGIILWGLALMQLPIMGLFDLWNSWWGNSGALIIPFMIGSFTIYLGMRRFGRLMRLKTRLTSIWFMLLIQVFVMAISAGAASFLPLYPFEGIETFTATVGWSAAFLITSAYIAWRIRNVIGREYLDAMKWLTIALGGYAFASMHEYTINFFLAFESPYLLYGLSIIPFALASLILVQASRKFYLVTIHASTASARTSSSALTDRDYIDTIVNIAGLASRPTEIDTILDDLRIITLTHDKDLGLSAKEKKQLIHIYYSLEQYLVTDEPLRNFTKQELRAQVSPSFRTLLD